MKKIVKEVTENYLKTVVESKNFISEDQDTVAVDLFMESMTFENEEDKLLFKHSIFVYFLNPKVIERGLKGYIKAYRLALKYLTGKAPSNISTTFVNDEASFYKNFFYKYTLNSKSLSLKNINLISKLAYFVPVICLYKKPQDVKMFERLEKKIQNLKINPLNIYSNEFDLKYLKFSKLDNGYLNLFPGLIPIDIPIDDIENQIFNIL